ncbi:MAG: hypothetical protein CGU28_09150 [Candidatus Dactylopiibacterium carminicum]|nr:MAG: hypothetical protein CGU28_09150 [Candidatus Dactylopiibacterium carminicum]
MPTLKHRAVSRLIRPCLCLISLCFLNGCAALAVSLAGAGAGAGLSHKMGSTASRTFSAPMGQVDGAILLAGRKLQLQVESVESTENVQTTHAKVADLDIVMELETLSPSLTRVSVTARKDFFRNDLATAQEIVTQVEQALHTLASGTPQTGGARVSPTGFPPTTADGASMRNPKSGAKLARNAI